MTIQHKRRKPRGAANATLRLQNEGKLQHTPQVNIDGAHHRMLRIPQRAKRQSSLTSANVNVDYSSYFSAPQNARRAESGALLPASIVHSPAKQSSSRTGAVTPSIGMTIGLSFCIVVLVTLTTILASSWIRRRMARRRELDCRKSPWTVRYRQERAQYISPRDVDDDDEQPAVERHGDVKHGSSACGGSAEQNEDTSASRVMRKSDWLVKLTHAPHVKRRTNIQADPFSSPVLMPSMPQNVCDSPRMRTMQQGEGHAEVVRRASVLPSPTTTLHDASFPSETQGLMPTARCSSQLEGCGGDTTTATAAANSVVGLGLLVGNGYCGSGNVDEKVKHEYVSSADMYAKWMPNSTITRREFEISSSLCEDQVRPSGNSAINSIYTAASVASESCASDVGEKVAHTSYASFAFLNDDAPPSSTWSKHSSQRQSSLPFTSPLLEEIFDEQHDARVTRNFVSAMRSIKRQMQHRPSEKSAAGTTQPAVRLSRQKSIRRRTRTSDTSGGRAKWQDGAGVVITLVQDSIEDHRCGRRPSVDDKKLGKHTMPQRVRKNKSVSVRGNEVRKALPVRSTTIDVLPFETAKCVFGSPLKPCDDVVRNSTQRSMSHESAAAWKSLFRRPTPLPTSLQALGRRVMLQKQTERHSHADGSDDGANIASRFDLITRHSVHRRSHSLDSNPSTVILGYLHRRPQSRASSITRSDTSDGPAQDCQTQDQASPHEPSFVHMREDRIVIGAYDVDLEGSRMWKCGTCIAVPLTSPMPSRWLQRRQSAFVVSGRHYDDDDDDDDHIVWPAQSLRRQRSVDSCEYASPTMQVFAFYETKDGSENDDGEQVNVVEV